MSLTNDQITAQNFKDYHNAILPYLNGQCPPIANKFAKGDMYSTDEKIVGQWIDGKPVWQRVVEINLSLTSGWAITTIPAGGIERVISATTISTGNSQVPVVCGCDNTYIELKSLIGNYDAEFLIFCYTKTTDDPIAIGDESDYSTTEKIVGTWIDGRPIYQKTINDNSSHSFSANTITDIPYSISDLDQIISCWGTFRGAPLPTSSFSGSTMNYHGEVVDDTNGIKFRLYRNGSAFTGSGIVITVQYVKSAS